LSAPMWGIHAEDLQCWITTGWAGHGKNQRTGGHHSALPPTIHDSSQWQRPCKQPCQMLLLVHNSNSMGGCKTLHFHPNSNPTLATPSCWANAAWTGTLMSLMNNTLKVSQPGLRASQEGNCWYTFPCTILCVRGTIPPQPSTWSFGPQAR